MFTVHSTRPTKKLRALPAALWLAFAAGGSAGCTADETGLMNADALPGEIVLGGAALAATSAPYVLNDARVDGELLRLEVEYGGGCAEHRFRVVGEDAFMESHPVRTRIRLVHEDGGDPCDGLLRSALTFGLGPLVTAYRQQYRQSTGEVILLLDGWDAELRLRF